MAPPYTIIVNTSDGYRDCWDPFFTPPAVPAFFARDAGAVNG